MGLPMLTEGKKKCDDCGFCYSICEGKDQKGAITKGENKKPIFNWENCLGEKKCGDCAKFCPQKVIVMAVEAKMADEKQSICPKFAFGIPIC